jgi:hypothetical protein
VGELTQARVRVLDGLTVDVRGGRSIITGDIVDQSQLHAVVRSPRGTRRWRRSGTAWPTSSPVSTARRPASNSISLRRWQPT